MLLFLVPPCRKLSNLCTMSLAIVGYVVKRLWRNKFPARYGPIWRVPYNVPSWCTDPPSSIPPGTENHLHVKAILHTYLGCFLSTRGPYLIYTPLGSLLAPGLICFFLCEYTRTLLISGFLLGNFR